MASKRTKDIPKKKKNVLVNLIDLIKKSNTVMIVSIENISAPQFQKIKRSLKDQAIVKVIKKTFMLKALEEAKKTKKDIEGLEKWLEKGFAIIFSNIDPFELASILADNKFPSKAKAGQTAPEDIIIEAGQTDLPAGPIISELGKLNIKAGIKAGKITIKESCVVAKKGESINKAAAMILAKLEITPFLIGFVPLAAYDTKQSKVYERIKVDKEEMLKNIKGISIEALNLALNINYLTKETTNFIIAKANQEANIILNLIK
ncbi:MAG: 50S ribosomal protein L10 [Candidatus Pacearchaeota archaeon]|nr:MAG: 50S ribosomal protein L10 [Candidatus Pacearchaeota archaeon]